MIDRSYLTVQRVFYFFDIASAMQLPGRWRIVIHLGMYFSKTLIMKADLKKVAVVSCLLKPSFSKTIDYFGDFVRKIIR